MERIALFCLIFFALIGTATLGIIWHEYSHFYDFKELNVIDDKICGLSLPTKWINWNSFIHQPIGYYAFKINNSNPVEMKKYQQINKNTELKAYAISAFILIFFVFCYWIIIFGRYRDKEKIIEKEIETIEKDFYIQQLESYILNHSNEN